MDKKSEKKKKKLLDRIDVLENEIRTSLGKKDSRSVEIDVPGHMRKIAELQAQFAKL